MSTSCTDVCTGEHSFVYFEPVYSTTAAVREGFDVGGPIEIEVPGKIYQYGQYILINESGKGIHILNNQDKTNPVSERFISIPGNFDMAVKDDILYADSYIDLLSIDISNIQNVQLLERVENAFPNYNTQFGFGAEDGQVIVEWQEINTVEVTTDCSSIGNVFFEGGVGFQTSSNDAAFAASSSPSAPTGRAGSLARFALHDNYLYAVDSWEMSIFDITNRATPVPENRISVGWGIETIFPYKETIFIGSASGMIIYDNSTPSNPVLLSEFMHATACDPVVANDTHAFITLRSGTECQGFTNQLDVVNIENLSNPTLVRSYEMDNPHGLGLDGNTLFICEGDFGLKVYDIEDVNQISNNQIAHFPEITAFDVIPNDKTLLMIGSRGLYQYDYNDVDNIFLLSVFEITPQEL